MYFPRTHTVGKNYIYDRVSLPICVYLIAKLERATPNRSIVIIQKWFLPKSYIFSNSDLDLTASYSKINRNRPLSLPICNTPVKFHCNPSTTFSYYPEMISSTDGWTVKLKPIYLPKFHLQGV